MTEADGHMKAQALERLQGQAGNHKRGQARERGETKRRKSEMAEDGGAGNGNEPSQRQAMR